MTQISLYLSLQHDAERTAPGRKHAIVVPPQSCISLSAANQPVTAFGSLTEMALSANVADYLLQ